MAKSKPDNAEAGGAPLLSAMLIVLGVLLTIVLWPTVVLFLVAMLPTLVAYIIDRTPQKYSAFCVGGMNFSGVFPYLMDLWSGTNDWQAAKDILTDPFALLVMYAAAAFGWLVYLSVPPVVGAALTVLAQRRVQQLRAVQARLVEEWGQGLASRPSEEAGERSSPPENR